MRRAMSAPVTFRVYPARSRRGLYVLVRVFETQRALARTLRDETGTRHGRTVRGVCQGHEVRDGRTWRLSPWFATVNLCRPSLGVGTVCHEFGHAMFRWAERKRVRPADGMDLEEVVLYGLTEMVRQFVNRAHDEGLYGG